MPDDRLEGVNLLNPEAGSQEREPMVEVRESAIDSPLQEVVTSSVDSQKLANVKSKISAQVAVVEQVEKEPGLSQIENILAENLGEIYSQLPEAKREAFKLKGEEAAKKIHDMMVTTKVKVHQVLKLISDWLGMIPGVNVYFLRQEAKLKLDKVMDYVEEQAKASQNSL